MGGPAARNKKASSAEDAQPAPAHGDDQSGSNRTTAAAGIGTEGPNTPSATANITSDSQQSPPAQSKASPPPPVNRGSWSWRAKASPVAQVARESILVEQGVSSENADPQQQPRAPSQSVSKSMPGNRKSVPLAAEATRIHATSDVGTKPALNKRPLNSPPAVKDEKFTAAADEVEDKEAESGVGAKAPSLAPSTNMSDATGDIGDTRPQSGSWLHWWSRPDGYGSDGEKLKGDRVAKKPRIEDDTDEQTGKTQIDQGTTDPKGDELKMEGVDQNLTDSKPEMTVNPAAGRTWFRLWSNAQNEQAAEENRAETQQEQSPADKPAPESGTQKPAAAEVVKDMKPNQTADNQASSDDGRPKSSGWAFWSYDKPKDNAGPPTPGDTQKQIGELAVADTTSQSHPEAAQFNEQRKKPNSTRPADAKRKSAPPTAKSPAPAPAVKGETKVVPVAASVPAAQAPAKKDTSAESSIAVPAPVQRGKKAQTQTRPNLILPTFRESFPPAPNPGYVERLTSYLASTLHLPGTEAPTPPVHPSISATPHRVKKAIAIGVHGFFPAAVFQTVLGPPTGTSIRFANYAAASIKEWCQQHQPDIRDVHIEKVALEGEGLISDRVATLWKLLLNWLSHLRQADFILVAAHSQGVPVATMLVAKLIQLGALAPNVRIGICAMAGINLGPFIEYKSRLLGSTALELFDFCDSGSKVSISYAEAMDVCLRHNVRVTFIGSLDDQLVSLESSLHAPLSHPYVSRAVFIDGRIHTSNFLTHLVVFSVKLRNRGISDHGLLREVSAPLAGSLVGGEGHSRVYDDPAVYACATEFALESTDMPVPAQRQAVAREAAGPATTENILDPSEREKLAAAAAVAASRRASLSGYPREMTAANHMRRRSSGLNALPGIAPVIAPYHLPPAAAAAAAGGAAGGTANTTSATPLEKNPFVLPWAVRGMLEEEAVRRDPALQAEVRQLVREFEEWRPTGKGLKDVRWRLEGVRSLL